MTETLSPISTTVESAEVIELPVMLIPPAVKFDIPEIVLLLNVILESPVPIKVPVADGNVNTAELPAE